MYNQVLLIVYTMKGIGGAATHNSTTSIASSFSFTSTCVSCRKMAPARSGVSNGEVTRCPNKAKRGKIKIRQRKMYYTDIMVVQALPAILGEKWVS